MITVTEFFTESAIALDVLERKCGHMRGLCGRCVEVTARLLEVIAGSAERAILDAVDNDELPTGFLDRWQIVVEARGGDVVVALETEERDA